MDREAILNLVLQLFTAVRFQRVSEIQTLTKKLSNLNSADLLLTTVSSESERNTILHVAAKHGCNHLVDVILKTNSLSSLMSVRNSRDNTAMHTAASSGHAHVVKSLISHVQKADQEKGTGVLGGILTAKNEQGNTLVHEAARKGRKQVMEMLRKILNPAMLVKLLNQVNNVGETPLSLAIHAMSSSTVETILKVKPNNSFELRGPRNQNILHMTILNLDLETMELILQNQPELSKLKDSNGRTPLHYAAALGNAAFVQKLLKHDAPAAYIVDDNQMIPLHLAVAHNNSRFVIVELYKSDPNTMEFTNGKKQNVLHIAAEKGRVRVVAYLLKLPEVDELINSLDEDGNTPLNLSLNNGHSNIVHLLFKDPRVNLRVINNETIRDTFSKLHQIASSSRGKDPEDGSEHLNLLTLKDDPQIEVNKLRFRIMSQAESIDDVLELPGHATRFRFENLPIDQKLKHLAGVSMLVATLVTTVTFALAFNLPGGYITVDGLHKGMAALSLKNEGFLFFVFCDVLAMIFSVSATSSLLITLWSDNHKLFVNVLAAAMYMTALALVLVTTAFIAGMWTVFEMEKLRFGLILVTVFIVVTATWYLALKLAERMKKLIRKWHGVRP